MRERPPHLIFLYGPPAVGKLTVATALAARCGFRVLHNHVTLDPVAEILPFATETFWNVVRRFRRDLVETAATEGIDLIYTFVFAPEDEPHVDEIVDAFEQVGGTVTFVQLLAPREELLRRVADHSRSAHGKITDALILEHVLDTHDVYATIPGRESLTLDLGTMSPDEAVERILEHVNP